MVLQFHQGNSEDFWNVKRSRTKKGYPQFLIIFFCDILV